MVHAVGGVHVGVDVGVDDRGRAQGQGFLEDLPEFAEVLGAVTGGAAGPRVGGVWNWVNGARPYRLLRKYLMLLNSPLLKMTQTTGMPYCTAVISSKPLSR